MATNPGGGGGGFATRISSKVRPQDPGGGGCNTDHRSPGRSCCRDWRSIRVDRRGTTVGACTGFGGVG